MLICFLLRLRQSAAWGLKSLGYQASALFVLRFKSDAAQGPGQLKEFVIG
jgi:hypothetical protein